MRESTGTGTGMGASTRLWRWRSNPLRRHDDVVEGWVMLVVWTVVLVGGTLAGLVTASAADQAFAQERTERHAVTAVVLFDVPRSTTSESDSYRASAKVRWTIPDSTVRTGRALVSAGVRAGSTTTLWQDDRGALTPEPASASEGAVEAGFLGVLAVLALAGIAFGAGALARGHLDQRRFDQWDREWELVSPQWNQRAG
ncbi:hypothetical protein AB0D14_31040 [Streptomyces sp. NPDC048484]|uniref:Rv1733c family protein n=1 Tax=Streptomyces sp. NPDC048484 TaxID=3155146 RepID=UPI003432C96D